MQKAATLTRIAWSNVVSLPVRSAIAVLLFAFLAVVASLGSSIVDAMDRSISDTVVHSAAGHLQVYDANAREPLALFGDVVMGAEDIGSIHDFPAVRRAALAVSGVEAIIPMASDVAGLLAEPELESAARTLATRRTGDAAIAEDVARVRRGGALVVQDLESRLGLSADTAAIEAALADARSVSDAAFEASARRNPAQAAAFVQQRVAPLAPEEEARHFRYIATDLDLFAQHFRHLEIIEGTAVPPGARGILLNGAYRDLTLKNRAARILDELARQASRGNRIAGDPRVKGLASLLPAEAPRLREALAPADAAAVEQELVARLQTSGLEAGLRALLTVDDRTLAERKEIFYAVVAPRIRLYAVQPGDEIVLRSTRSNRAIRVTVHGAFRFRGINEEGLGGLYPQNSLADLETFRELNGIPTAAELAEQRAMRPASAATALATEWDDATVFGEESPSAATAVATAVAPAPASAPEVLNAAVLVRDPARLNSVKAALERELAARSLPVQVVDWRGASGMIGQFFSIVRFALYATLAAAFFLAVVIVDSALMLGMLSRVQDLGSLRAMGASRAFISALIVAESAVLATLGFAIGGGAAMLIGRVLEVRGIPPFTPELTFLFAGGRLHPAVGGGNLAAAAIVIVVTMLIAAIHPARRAAGVPPALALQDST